MSKTIRVKYYGMDGEGTTVTEAKKDAGRKITEALDGDYIPEILEWRGYAILVYREPEGWCSRTIADPEDGIKAGCVYGNPSSTREETIQSARRHLAQMGWKPEDGFDLPTFVTNRNDIADHYNWCKAQLRWRKARDAGLDANDCHAYACKATFRDDWAALVERVEGVRA